MRWLKAAAFVTEPGWGADRGSTNLSKQLSDLPDLSVTYEPGNFPAAGAKPARPPADNPDTVGYLAFTSGTTGAPKCVMHADNTLLANARDLVRDWHVGPDTRILTLSPVSHHIAWVAVGQWLASGGALITDDPPAGMSRLDWIVENGATYVMGVPTHAMDILAEQRARGAARMGDVTVFYMAGAPIPPSVAEAFVAQGIKPQNIYGMTENSSHHYTHPDDSIATAVATCGRGGPAYEVTILDRDDPDREVPPGTLGQIAGRGAALMLGYFANQEATGASFNRNGWFLSGDLGSLDDAGNLRIEGRLKELIIRGGHNIHPTGIEAMAVRHPAVERAAAFAVPDERLGEKVCLAIIGTAEPVPLLDFMHAQGLSKYDMPEYFIRMEAFPLTASGKILKRELAERARSGALAPVAIRFAERKEPV
jgi:acyl-CoA synthetase